VLDVSDERVSRGIVIFLAFGLIETLQMDSRW
jgi:hypothetical protein